MILQRVVEDSFRGRVFAAELALLTLTMAASNYVTGELLDSFGVSPRWVTAGIGLFFCLPGIAWFMTRRLWDREPILPPRENKLDEPRDLSVIHHSTE